MVGADAFVPDFVLGRSFWFHGPICWSLANRNSSTRSPMSSHPSVDTVTPINRTVTVLGVAGLSLSFDPKERQLGEPPQLRPEMSTGFMLSDPFQQCDRRQSDFAFGMKEAQGDVKQTGMRLGRHSQKLANLSIGTYRRGEGEIDGRRVWV